MYFLDNSGVPQDVLETTFADLNMVEADVEEMLRKNIRLVCDEDESLLVVGQQVRNRENGRSDLMAIDGNGHLVLVEIKRDRKDIESRVEAFEFQAIRYAASCATIERRSDLISNVFAPYIEQHKDEFDLVDDDAIVTATRLLRDFLDENDVDDASFNCRQRIILVASDFDPQTLSAVAWLAQNKLDISCFRMCPYVIEGKIILDMKKLLPLQEYRDYFVEVTEAGRKSIAKRDRITRRNLPKIDELIANNVVQEGDVIKVKDKEIRARLLANGHVKPLPEEAVELSLQQWLRGVLKWSSVQTYIFSIHERSGKSLGTLREEWMETFGQ